MNLVTDLSIIIPAGDDVSSLEDTLVSVLSNRPARCEVIVTHAGNYDDPYQLFDEVRFLQMPVGSNTAQQIAKAMNVAQGSYFHLLSPGCEAQVDWWSRAQEWLKDASIGSVAPLVLAGADPTQVYAAGVAAGFGGRRIEVGRGYAAGDERLTKLRSLGPTRLAGFYRREAVARARGWPEYGDSRLADLDLALSLRRSGYQTALAPQSRVILKSVLRERIGAFTASRDFERLFLRHTFGAWTNVFHPAASIWGCVSAGGPLSMAAAAAGKIAAALKASSWRRHALWLDEQQAIAGRISDAHGGPVLQSPERPARRAA